MMMIRDDLSGPARETYSPIQVSDEQVGDLARFAALPLPEARRAIVAATLNAWIGDANELSRKMSRPEFQTIVPATVFVHGPNPDEDA